MVTWPQLDTEEILADRTNDAGTETGIGLVVVAWLEVILVPLKV